MMVLSPRLRIAKLVLRIEGMGRQGLPKLANERRAEIGQTENGMQMLRRKVENELLDHLTPKLHLAVDMLVECLESSFDVVNPPFAVVLIRIFPIISKLCDLGSERGTKGFGLESIGDLPDFDEEDEFLVLAQGLDPLLEQTLADGSAVDELKVRIQMLGFDVVECYGVCFALSGGGVLQTGGEEFGVLREYGFVEDEGLVATLERHRGLGFAAVGGQ